MILHAALVSGFALRRMVTARTALGALLAGGLAGVLVRSVPAPSLAVDVLVVLVPALAALLVLPLAARLPTGDRAGGYEQLVAVRPLSSVAWGLGRLAGSMAGAALLVALLAATAVQVARGLPVPQVLEGKTVVGPANGHVWRFDLAAGTEGALDLLVDVVPVRVTGAELKVEVQRGGASRTVARTVRSQRRLTVVLPDLSPERGDLFVTLRPGPGLLLGASSPRLVVGDLPLAGALRPVSGAAAATLSLAMLATLAAACAFHFETACLAGMLALAVSLPEKGWVLAIVLCVLGGMAVLGTALVRRQALP